MLPPANPAIHFNQMPSLQTHRVTRVNKLKTYHAVAGKANLSSVQTRCLNIHRVSCVYQIVAAQMPNDIL